MITIPNIALFDICLGLFYLIIIYFFAFRYQKKKVEDYPEYRYYLIGLTTKITGALAFVIISIYYYKKGDTFLYFQIAEDLRSHLFVDTSETIKLLFTPYSKLTDANFNPLERYNYYYERSTNWMFGRIVFFFNLISFGSYFVCSILMSVVSFLGLWLGYKSMSKLYPKVINLMLIPFFLVPTALIWSSGILRDTLIIGAIGMLLYAFANIFIFRKKLVLNIILIVFGIIILQLLKPILLLTLIPCLFFWGFLYLSKPIPNLFSRVFVRFSFIVIILGFGYYLDQTVIDSSSKYKTENLLKTIKGFQSFHSMEIFSEGKNVYTLGGYTATPLGVIKKIPEAINVTLFRPYVWEINNWPMLLGAVESLLLLMFFVLVLLRAKKYFFMTLVKNNEVIFMILFSIIYATVVGISSYNFGALSRYKIPGVMLFQLLLLIVYAQSNQAVLPKIITSLMSKFLINKEEN
jgi:hypothetical protein